MLIISHPDSPIAATAETALCTLAQRLNKTIRSNTLLPANIIATELEDESMLFLCVPLKHRIIQAYLNALRAIRIPYVFVPADTACDFSNTIVPVSMLEEEVEKAQFAAALGRFCNAHTTLLCANDYGSRAQHNADKIALLLDKFSLPYNREKGQHDSFKIEYDALNRATDMAHDVIIISASRDYGWDDLLFGPKERHIIMKARVPVMVVNPRGDLYALCD